MSRLYMYGT